MSLWKKEYLLPSIKGFGGIYQKQSGQIEWVMGLFYLLLLGILLATQLQIASYRATALYLEDALAASNLASALVDLEEYGITHIIELENPQTAYAIYCRAVRENLGLNESWEGTNETLISGKVTVENYSIYNVRENVVTIYTINNEGKMMVAQGVLGAVNAPNGQPVTTTGIYSELSFDVKGILGVKVTARKGKLVDIVAGVK